MQLPLIVWVSAVVGFGVILYSLPDFQDKAQFSSWANLTVLILTLIALIWYAYDTHRLTEQTVEKDLRPIVLVQGVINWPVLSFTSGPNGTVAGTPIQFVILKNTALNFRGYIINNGQKYNLLFGNQASGRNFLKTWGWVAPGDSLSAVYDPNISPVAVTAPNGIFLEFSDTEHNLYHTIVDTNYVQNSERGPLNF
ncbi:MAG: hypothetical protein PHD04_02985 [Candidatus Pacebacteria bacterium]|nr:hypothetical protein [Candidatus Paceibacterota bacterium]